MKFKFNTCTLFNLTLEMTYSHTLKYSLIKHLYKFKLIRRIVLDKLVWPF